MANHRAPTVTRALAHGVHRAAPEAARGIGATVRRAGRGTRAAGRLSGRAAWKATRILGMATLALSWVALLLLLLTLSLAMGKGGNVLRETVTRDMLTPLGEGARQALAARQGHVTVTPATRARRAQSHGMRALAGLQAKG